MIMAGLEFRGDIPFSHVYFTSIIRDDQGRKLSKSLNNSPNPLDVIAIYGADALRFTMIYISPMGQDLRYSNEKCEIGRNFANKLWNAARFRQAQGAVSRNWESVDGLTLADLRPDDRWIVARLSAVIGETTAALDDFAFHDVAHSLYEFVWNEFCDWYLESAKAVLYEGSEEQRDATLRVFDHAMSVLLRLMHPVMPFVTEEIYHQLGYVGDDDSIMLAPWPETLSADALERLGATSELVARNRSKFEMIRAVRNVKASYQIPAAKKVKVVIAPTDVQNREFLQQDLTALQFLLYASEVALEPDYQPEGPTGTAVSALGTAYLPLSDVIDIDAERARLEKQADEVKSLIQRSARKLENEKFVNKAPEHVVQLERDRLTENKETLVRLHEQLNALG